MKAITKGVAGLLLITLLSSFMACIVFVGPAAATTPQDRAAQLEQWLQDYSGQIDGFIQSLEARAQQVLAGKSPFQAVTQMQDLINQYVAQIQAYIQTLEAQGQDVFQDMSDIWAEFRAKVEAAFTEMSAAAQQAIQQFQELCPGFADQIKAEIDQLLTDLMNGVNWRTAFTTFFDAIKADVEGVQDEATALFGALKAAAQTFFDAVRVAVEDLIADITALIPASGEAGKQVTITGSDFGSKRGTSYVLFGNTKVKKYVSWTKTRIKVLVPTGVKGKVSVKVMRSGQPSNALRFAVKR